MVTFYNDTIRYGHQNESDVFLSELLAINRFWDRLENIYRPLELTIYVIGIAGNFLALTTLARSTKMHTPSFSYHRALVTAEFLYCANYLINFLINRHLAVECRENVFRYWLAAFVTGILNPAVSSVCNYVLHYVTTLIALDRVLALHSPVGYHKWNRASVAKIVIALAVAVSTLVHSWSAFIQTEVNEFRIGDQREGDAHQLLISYPCWNDSVVYYSVKRENIINSTLGEALRIKEIYNGAFRMTYSIVLTLLTLAVIAGLVRRRRRRESARSIISLVNAVSDTTSCTIDRKTSCAVDRKCRKESEESYLGRWKRRNRGCERVLFVLMIAVLLLAFFQVAASETNRMLQILYPPTDLTQILIDTKTTVNEKLAYIRISMYGHFYSRLFASVFTAVERSFVCILYIAMNALFRQELLAMLTSFCCCGIRLTGVSKRMPIPTSTRTLVALQEQSRLIVANVEPVSGYNYRSVTLAPTGPPWML